MRVSVDRQINVRENPLIVELFLKLEEKVVKVGSENKGRQVRFVADGDQHRRQRLDRL